MNQVIVFCKTKQSVDQVARDLQRRNVGAAALHGDKSQQSRLETLAEFKSGNLRVLVATDVAARGLDIAELPFVINYEMPVQAEDYVHRIGRTGRAGAEGVAISLMDENEQKLFESIKALIGKDLPIERIEGFEPKWWAANQTAANHDVADASTNRRHKSSEKTNANHRQKSVSAEQSCSKIPGRPRRQRHQKSLCALVLPNYGVE